MATDYTQDANCVAAYTMKVDESPIDDVSANSNTAALKGAGEPNYTTDAPAGYQAGSYDFAGDDDILTVSDDPTLDDIMSSGGSIVCWTYADSFQGGGSDFAYIAKKTDFATYGWLFLLRDDGTGTNALQLSTYGTDDGYWIAGDDLEESAWMHLAVTFDGSGNNTPILYRDGSSLTIDAADAQTVAIGSDDGADIEIGGRSSDNLRNLDGHLTEVALFDDILTSTEINDIMDNGLDGSLGVSTGFMTLNTKFWG